MNVGISKTFRLSQWLQILSHPCCLPWWRLGPGRGWQQHADVLQLRTARCQTQDRGLRPGPGLLGETKDGSEIPTQQIGIKYTVYKIVYFLKCNWIYCSIVTEMCACYEAIWLFDTVICVTTSSYSADTRTVSSRYCPEISLYRTLAIKLWWYATSTVTN